MTEPPAYVCPICGKSSWHPEDGRQGFCNGCHAFTSRCSIGLCPRPPAVIAGNIAVCREHGIELGLA